jgi:HEAT repeat protein
MNTAIASLGLSLFLFAQGAGRVPIAPDPKPASRGERVVAEIRQAAETVLELARAADRETRHAAIYFGLSTFADKSEAVVDALIATLADPDPNDWERALWGLGHGVPEALQRKVAAALVELHNGRSDPRTRERCARTVRQYAPELEAKLKR